MMSNSNVRYYTYKGKNSASITDTSSSKEYEGIKYIYCQIVGTAKLFSREVTISIDYGQERSFWKDNRLKDENGKIQSFNSMVDALNYMGNQGWEFVEAYVITFGNQNVYHYLLKKNNP